MLQLGSIIVSLITISLNAYNNKNYLQTRPTSAALSIGFEDFFDYEHQHKYRDFTACLVVTPFFSESTNGQQLGEYFGIGNGSATFSIGNPEDGGVSKNAYQEIDGRLILHDTNAVVTHEQTAQSNISFSPEQRLCGAYIFGAWRPTSQYKDFIFSVLVPCEWQERSVKGVFENLVLSNGRSVEAFFHGNVSDAATVQSGQKALTKVKIIRNQTKSGISDLQVQIGWTGFKSSSMRTSLIATAIIPTGPKDSNSVLFGPKIGNGQHFGLGGGISSHIDLYKGQYGRLKLSTQSRLLYLFQGNEIRTPGIQGKAFGHYFLLGEKGQQNMPLTPAANLISQKIRVTPGFQIHTGLFLGYNYCDFFMGVGYESFWKDSERLKLRSFNLENYGFAKQNYNLTQPFTIHNTLDGRFLNRLDLDLNKCKTPELFTSRISARIGYTWIPNSTAISTELGGSYEIASSHTDLEGYLIWAKSGFAF